MVRGVILATDGVCDSQVEYAFYRLQEEGALVDVLTPGGEAVAGSRGGEWDDSVSLSTCAAVERYDLVIVPSGVRVDAFDGTALRSWLRAHDAARTVLAAIGDGVGVLARLGVLRGHRASGPPAASSEMPNDDVEWCDEVVTVDGHVVTAGRGAALPYLVAAALDSTVLRQRADDELTERPAWR
ncbi:DJ-1/PfpI family protein [Salinigranum sp. GCM10025319]|uniref:DJ-1/PfpI family protein n=1 Tax=Salinigranum sp. GCM10025319 TaxID=3252687 RepID=UPI0036202B25